MQPNINSTTQVQLVAITQPESVLCNLRGEVRRMRGLPGSGACLCDAITHVPYTLGQGGRFLVLQTYHVFPSARNALRSPCLHVTLIQP